MGKKYGRGCERKGRDEERGESERMRVKLGWMSRFLLYIYNCILNLVVDIN